LKKNNKWSRKKGAVGRLGPGLGFGLAFERFGNSALNLLHIDFTLTGEIRLYSSIMPKFESQRRKKRRFCGNRFVNTATKEPTGLEGGPRGSKESLVSDEDQTNLHTPRSVSFRKLQLNTQEKPESKLEEESIHDPEPTITGFRFIDMEILADIFTDVNCKECGEAGLLFMEDDLNRKGCASSLHLICNRCDWKRSFFFHPDQMERVLR